MLMGRPAKNFERRLQEWEIRGIIETIQTITFLKSARILKKRQGDLKSVVVTQFLVKNKQLKLL